MKKLVLLLIAAITLASCGGNKGEQSIDDLIAEGNLEAIQTRRDAVKAKQTEIQAELDLLDAKIRELDKSDNSALVTTHVISDTLFKHYIEIQGNVETKQNVIVYPEYQGTLTRVFVKEGDRVSKGQTLARIDDGGLGSQVSQLEVQAQLAKTTYDRQKRLWEQKIGSEIQYLQAKTNYESAQNAVDQLKSQLAKTAVRAPFSGVIDDVITDQGTVVAPGQGIFRIVNLKDMYVKASVPERYLSTVSKGKDVEVEIPMIGETIDSKVRQTGNYINPNNRSFTIEVDVPNQGGVVKPNLTARVRINDYTNEKALLVPLNVISENAEGNQYVYTAAKDTTNTSENAIATRQFITTGKTQGDKIEVLTGLKAGDAIIVEGARSVRDGQEVKILKL
ncbi:efflux RND transporter periplasmic adaptor subunit [Aureisphaera galaxeae]|uniref:efflux RND transporter periplasmic adaptor subunit n=1 Tax=Aureisphaera galaxeae TaxID=1538023 RepID=UPI002350AAC2|nr:efflux RND transporter periplasmic adaptor subunit [Aureisphaera galaxeae]MDC8005935.1 efflux RND transporter periplasmic adaptor subunit [Aureisphaera galaxeae]